MIVRYFIGVLALGIVLGACSKTISPVDSKVDQQKICSVWEPDDCTPFPRPPTPIPTPPPPPDLRFRFTQLSGYADDDVATGVAQTYNGVYVSGYKYTSGFNHDATLTKSDPTSGRNIWAVNFGDRELGTSCSERAEGVALDKNENVYIAGSRDCRGNPTNVFIAKYSRDGVLVKYKVFNSSDTEEAKSISIDQYTSDVYVVDRVLGNSYGTSIGNNDILVMKLDPNTLDFTSSSQWKKRFGTSSDDFAGDMSVSLDSFYRNTYIYIVGSTRGNIGATNQGQNDAFMSVFKPDGSHVWSQQWGTSENDEATSIDAASYKVYITGNTSGNLFGTLKGLSDIFIIALPSSSSPGYQWQMGTSSADYATGVAIGNGSAYIAGYTYGSWDGTTNSGLTDAFLIRPIGPSKAQMLGSGRYDFAHGIAVNDCSVCTSGETIYVVGQIDTIGINKSDGFLTKFNYW